MDANTIRLMRADFGEYRRRLLVDTDAGPQPLAAIVDDWQRADFEAIDDALRVAAGLEPVGTEPVRQFAYLERPRGHSKTSDIAVAVSWALFASQRPLSAIAAAADADQAKLLRDAIARLVVANPRLAPVLDVQAARVRNTQTGSELQIISSDAASSYGALCDLIVADELTHWRANADQLWHSLFSTVAKRKRCGLLCIGNAGTGQGTSWQWKLRETARESSSWYFNSLDGPQASWISQATLAEQRRMLPAVAFDRLWLNKWTAGEGDALAEGDLLASVVLDGPTREPQRGWSYVAGVDLGLARDCSAVVVVARNHFDSAMPEGTLKVCDVKAWKPKLFKKVRVEDIEQHILDCHARYRLSSIAFDPWQSEYLSQRLNDAGLPCQQVPMVPKNLQAMATSVTEAFSERNIQLYDDSQLLADLRALRVVEKQYGWRLDPVRNADGHGDRAVALALSLFAAGTAQPAVDSHVVGDSYLFQTRHRRFNPQRVI
jgi:phage terminase large subunit-like protein